MLSKELEKACDEWGKHAPFKRASPELIRKVERYEKLSKVSTKEQFLDNLEESLF
jgi:hypothetical protein